jgi:hypothetical protein
LQNWRYFVLWTLYYCLSGFNLAEKCFLSQFQAALNDERQKPPFFKGGENPLDYSGFLSRAVSNLEGIPDG